jgi:hypothetical protein
MSHCVNNNLTLNFQTSRHARRGRLLLRVG